METKPEYTVKFFIKKFEAIPEERWLVRDVGVTNSGTHYAMGHCLMQNGGGHNEATALFDILGGSQETIDINNGYCGTGSTPRQRILNALYAKLRTAASIK